MASLSSFPFTIGARNESFVLLRKSNGCGLRSSFSACKPEKTSACVSFRVSVYGFLRIAGEHNHGGSMLFNDGLVFGCGRGPSCSIVPVRAKGEGSAEGEDEWESDDAVRATIEKSKKVLAMQRELLNQIAERRKLVSSIRSVDPMVDDISSVESETSSYELNRNTNEATPEEYGITDHSVSSKESSERDRTLVKGSSSPTKVSLYVEPPRQIEKISKTPGFLSPLDGDLADVGKEPRGISLHEDVELDAKLLEKAAGITAEPASLLDTTESSSYEDKGGQDVEETLYNWAINNIDEPAVDDVEPQPLAGTNVMNVILVAAECAPWSKTGGLGDVAGALPKALARRGHRVMVVAPRYGNYAETQDSGIRKRYRVDGQDIEVGYFQTYIDGVDFVFIEGPPFRGMERDIYGGSRKDVLKRMVLFCKAAIEVPWHVPCGGVCYGDGNLVFIANDWHTALLPVYLKAYYRDHGQMIYTRAVLVIHNIAHQGRGPVDEFSILDLPGHYLDFFRLYDPVGGEHLNIFAAGLKCADRIATVSHGYAWELKTCEGGWGLHGIINENDWKLRGIVNGIDPKEWNPRFDVFLQSDGYTNYSIETVQAGKARCKEALQKELGLPVRPDVPLIGFIGRLDGQKGVDLIAEAVPWMMGQDVQLVMLGTGRSDLEMMLKQLESQYRDKARGWVGFSVQTAHRITAGADILLMPSRFEPCGLNQLYAMNYGTIPVVHAVGGLRDTVQPFDPVNESGLGWTFDRAESGKLIDSLGNCLLTYREYKQSWEGLQRRGMMQDHSWDHAAVSYEEVLVAAKYQW